MTKQETDYRNKEKNARQDLANAASQEANTTSRTTSGQLLLIAGAILTFSASVMSSSYAAHLSLGWDKALILSWVLFALSALLGIIGLFIDYSFFRKWQTYHFAVAESISESIGPDEAAEINKDKKPKRESPLWPLIAQSILIVIAVTIFIVVISRALMINK